MEDNGGSKLKEMFQKWQNVTLGPKEDQESGKEGHHHGGISPAISRRLRSCEAYYDSDEDGCQSPEALHGVPRGYLAVYVGSELRRFIIPTSYLSDPLFKVLLEKVEEEFGFEHSGALTIPCEIETFKYLLNCMKNHQKTQSEPENQSSERNQNQIDIP